MADKGGMKHPLGGIRFPWHPVVHDVVTGLVVLVWLCLTGYLLWRVLGGRPRPHWRITGSWVRLQPQGAAKADVVGMASSVAAALGTRMRGRLQIVRMSDGHSVQLMLAHSDPHLLERLAQAVGAQAVPCDPPGVRVRMSGWLQCPWWQGGTKEVPPDPQALSDGLGRLLAETPEPAVVVARVGPMWAWRMSKYRRWVRTQLGGQHAGEVVMSRQSHPHLSANVLYRVSVGGGADSPQYLKTLLGQCMESTPGFDYMWRLQQLQVVGPVLGMGLSGVGLGLVGAVPVLWLLWALVAAAWTLLAVSRVLGHELANPVMRQVSHGLCPSRAPLGRWPTRLYYGYLRHRQVPPVPGLPMSADQIVVWMQPPRLAGAGGEGQSAAKQPAPPQLRTVRSDAPLVGVDVQGRPVWLDPDAREEGFLVTGDPGQGKTVACLTMWGADLVNRRRDPDPRRCMLWLETKGDGAQRALQMAVRAGYDPGDILLLDCGASVGPRLELLDRLNPGRSANEITEALTYALPAGSIMGSSAQAMVAAFSLALQAGPATWPSFGGQPPSVLKLVLTLMGGVSSEAQSVLWEFFRDRVQRPAEAGGPRVSELQELMASADESTEAVERWGYYMAMNPRDRDPVLRPPINKIADLLAAKAVWTPDPQRPDVGLLDLLQSKRVAIINFGGGGLTPQVAQRLAATTLYLLRSAIERTCSGWQRAGWSVSVYADEVSHLCDTGSGQDIISWFKDAGRSYGVRLILGTQRMDQLSEMAVRTLSTLGTKLYLRTESPQMAKAGAVDLGQFFTDQDLRSLPQFEGVLRTRWQGVPQPPFNLRLIPEQMFHQGLVLGTDLRMGDAVAAQPQPALAPSYDPALRLQ